jgi:hypothetical protein
MVITHYGILLLVIIYLGINIHYRNLTSLVLFLFALVSFYNIMDNKLYAVMLAYVISISYNIIKNFHLLENFGTKTKEQVPVMPATLNELKTFTTLNKPKPKLVITDDEDSLKKKRNEDVDVDVDVDTGKIYDIGDIISDESVDEFIDKLKRRTNIKIINKKLLYSKFNPILSTLETDLVQEMKEDIEYNGSKLLDNPIIVSRDNYIINGHYQWYIKGLFLAEKNENTILDSKYLDRMTVKMIDLDINSLMKKLEEYKLDHNSKALNKFSLNKEKLNDLRGNINNLKETASNLEKHYNELVKIKMV